LKFLEFFLISVTLLNDTTNEVALFEKAKAKLLGEWVMVGGTGLALLRVLTAVLRHWLSLRVNDSINVFFSF
jgi:hypothetical protein